MIYACFGEKEPYGYAYGLRQWDYGQILRVQGLRLPPAVEIHFSLQKAGGEAVTRIGVTRDGVTDVPIPESMLENETAIRNYEIYAFIYPVDEESGHTAHIITMPVTARPKPEAFETPEDAELFRDAIAAVSESAGRAESAERSAEAWAHGREDMPERAEDNAAYYAGQARDTAKEIPGQVADAKKEIDKYADEKAAELKGDTGNVYFAAFKVVSGRLKMYSDPSVDKVRFRRVGSRLKYRLNF